MTALAPTLQAFFTDRLIGQREASTHTIAAYRDAFRLLLGFAETRCKKAPSDLDLDDLDAETIGAFLAHLRDERHNVPRTRNARLSAVHSLFRYAALRHPEHAATIQGVLAVPPTRFEKVEVAFLNPDEVDALISGSRMLPVVRAAGPRALGSGDPNRAQGVRADRAHLW